MEDPSSPDTRGASLSGQALLTGIRTRPTALLEADTEGRILWGNAAWAQVSGEPAETLVTQSLRTLLTRRCASPAALAPLLEALEAGRCGRARLPLRHQDGRSYWAEVELEVRSSGWLLVERDVTERLASERRVQAILSAGTEGIIEFGSDGAIVACNAAAAAIVGMSADELIGRRPAEPGWRAIREDGRPFPVEEHAASVTLRTGKPVQDSVIGIPAGDGRVRWLNCSTRPLHADDGALEGALAVIRDITRSREAANRLATLVRGAGVATWEIDLATGKATRDAAWGELLGLDAGAVPDTVEGWQRRVHPEDYPRVVAARDRHLNGELPEYRCEYRLRREDGRWTWVLDAGQIVERDFSGRPRRIAGVHVDISELREAHAEATRVSRRLADQRSELQAIIDAIPALVFYKDDTNRILDLNRMAAQAVGLPVEDCRGRRVDELFPAEDARKYLEDDRTVFRTGRPRLGIVERYRGADGQYRSLRTDKIPLRGPDGRCDRVVSVAVDVSEQLAREARLEQALADAHAASLAKSRFLANLGHEIRTALTAILGYADMLGERAETPARDRAESAGVLRRAGERLLATINDILDLSQVESGSLALEPVDMSLIDLLRELELSIRPRLSGTRLSLELRAPVPERIVSDPGRLRQILRRLLEHALKTEPAGPVTLALGAAGGQRQGHLTIEVTAPGLCLTAEEAERAFEPLTPANEPGAPRHDAERLGLVIAGRLAQLLGGALAARPNAPGQAGGFLLELPLRASAGATMVTMLPDTPAASSPRMGGEHPLEGVDILVVEDGADNRRLICHYLEAAGARVVDVPDGAAALEELARRHGEGRRPALVVSDIDMPVMDGCELAREATRRGLAPPMLALTAHALAEDRARCEAAGFSAYLVKPIDRQALLHTCVALVGRSQPVTAVTANATMNGDDGLMLSEFADDPDMHPLLAEFVGELPERMSQMNVLAAAGEHAELGRLAHQLKGAGGGYGYPAITEAAAELECAARESTVDPATVADALARLAALCAAAAAALEIPQACQAGAGR